MVTSSDTVVRADGCGFELHLSCDVSEDVVALPVTE